MNPLIQLKTTPAILVALACFAVSPGSRAVNPPPDGGYPGGNTAEGTRALFNLTTGTSNTATGFEALFKNTTGSRNTANGTSALHENINGINNTATGNNALYNNQTGSENTATGTAALRSNSTGSSNTAHGFQALLSNTTDSFNTAIGVQALFSNTGFGGHNNVATGYQALFSNTTGRRNTADGNAALYSNTIGNFNVAVGDQALFSLATVDPANGNGNGNTGIGWAALATLTTGGGNTAIGNSALVNSVTGFQNVALGYVAAQNLTTGHNNIDISNPGVAAETNTIRIGNVVPFTDIYGFGHAAHTATYIAGINGQTASGGVAVYINSDGKLGTLTSSARFKTEVRPMEYASEAILALKPVTFRYKKQIDPKGIPQFGLVAEEVEKVNPDLVARDADGKPYTVRYDAVNAMLLNEFLKEHRKVEQLTKDFESKLAEQQKQIEALSAGLQKVSAQLEASKPAPRTVLNNQ
jgi:trimeric autotransporter adhesin